MKEAYGASCCQGSGYLVGRDCLDAVGGFPTSSIAEDFCLTLLLQNEGWYLTYVNENLQYGRVPETFAAHITQQARWVSLKNSGTMLVYACDDTILAHWRRSSSLRSELLLPGQGRV